VRDPAAFQNNSKFFGAFQVDFRTRRAVRAQIAALLHTGNPTMLRFFAITLALALASAPATAATYTLEPNYTQGVFRWDHLGFSFPAGQFAQAEGTLEFDPAAPTMSSVKVSIPLSTLATGVPGLDEHLRSADFFEIMKFPVASFASVRVEQGAMKERLKVHGNLTIHGVTRPVTLDVTIRKVGANPRTQIATVGFDATATLKRSDFGLGRFVPQVSDEVRLQLVCQAAEATGYAAYLKAAAEEKAAAQKAQKK
jgi:polyisoprenoid-binding protein YceI